MVLSIDFRDSVSFLPTIQATGLLTLALTGLTPAECASLVWTYGSECWSPPPWCQRASSCPESRPSPERSRQAVDAVPRSHLRRELVRSAPASWRPVPYPDRCGRNR